ncbi:MAG: DNA mismatch repair endonuclease MutL [Clostridiales bacterium]|nr:DNA mismatch repair endonuclease MutL [Clostridiales bacterium]
MGRIHRLPPHLADMIAAGEVVERPGSVVKELVENSIDAGSSSVTIEIQRGGMSYIRVTDDGYGMSEEDAKTAFLRHATSKLTDERGLESIKSLGFRGEALAAIAAVSNVDMLTRERGSAQGVSLSLSGGELTEVLPAGCPEGTTIIVRDLFFNTPARLKFMKKDSAEGANVTSAVIKLALSHPGISVRYIKDGREELSTPGDGDAASAVYAVFGREFFSGLLTAEASAEGVDVKGFVSAPAAARGNRSAQYFFVNGRSVKSALLTSALEQAYKNSLFTNRSPACVLYIKVKYSAVDVNVHPAKTEVKFLYERAVFDAVYSAALAALAAEKGQSAKVSPVLPETGEQRQSTAPVQKDDKPHFLRLTADEYKQSMGANLTLRDAPAEYRTGSQNITPDTQAVFGAKKGADKADVSTKEPRVPDYTNYYTGIQLPEDHSPEIREKAAPPERKQPDLNLTAGADYKIIGECFDSYIIVQRADEIIFIDKHAAHERINFDRLKNQASAPMSQELISPAAVKLDGEDAELLLENIGILEEAGLGVEDFGSGSILVRSLPQGIGYDEAQALIEELAEAIKLGGRPGGLGSRDEVLATVACKASVKAGWKTDPKELVPIVKAVVSGKVKYCPHGRPVSLAMPRSRLDRTFKRT